MDQDGKPRRDLEDSSARNSACEETMNTSTSSVERYSTAELQSNSSGVDLRRSAVSPPPDFPREERSFSNTIGRILTKSKKKYYHDEQKEISATLIKEFMTMQIQRTDSNASQITNPSINSATNSELCLADKYGHLEEVLGHGAQATVRLAHLHQGNAAEKLWAVKV